jgi:hypothetical protein
MAATDAAKFREENANGVSESDRVITGRGGNRGSRRTLHALR